jgi:ribose 5-phosphate isomerase A
VDDEKRIAAETAAMLVEPGMLVGLGTGSTVAFLLDALAARRLEFRCVATSLQTETAARRLGFDVLPFDGENAPVRLDLAIDGADQVTRAGWLVKGGGAAHTREKLVEATSARFVVIVSSDKLVDRIAPPIPLELMRFGLAGTLARLRHARLRDVGPSPDGGVIADWTEDVDDPAALAAFFESTPGVVEHGLFPPALVTEVIVGRDGAVERFQPSS